MVSKIFLVVFLLSISLTSALPSDSDVDLIFNYPINYSLIPTVNNTDHFAGYSLTGFITYLNGLYCQLTGCTMAGTINMNDNPITELDHIDFDLTENHPATEGRLSWSSDDGTLSLGMPGGNVNLQIGQEQLIRVKAGEAISNGEVVYFFGSTGNNPVVHLADATSEDLAESTLGIATEDIASGQHGYITTFGLVRDVDTSAFTENSTLYLSPTPGQLTETEPTKPNYTVMMGYVVKSHATEGIIFARIHQQIWKHDIATTTYFPTSIETIVGTNDTAENVSLVSGAYDGLTFNVSETTGTPASDIRVNFTGVSDFNFGTNIVWYDGSDAHHIDICLWDYTAGDWYCDPNWEILNNDHFEIVSGSVFNSENFISGGLVQMRYVHTMAGNINHDFYIDYIALTDGQQVLFSNDHDSLGGRDDILLNHPNSDDIFFLKDGSETIIDFMGGNITYNGTDNIWDFR